MSASTSAHLVSALDQAEARIAPLWPLEHFVAVNPFVGLVDRPFADACRLLERTSGAAPLVDRAQYLSLYDAGAITNADLAAVAPAGLDPAALHRALSTHREPAPRLRLLSGFADNADGRPHWEPFLTQEVAKWCATYFDDNQTTWRSPWRAAGLYAGWRELASLDRNPEVFGCRGFRAYARALPADATDAIALLVGELGVLGSRGATPLPQSGAAENVTDLFHTALLTVAGWAGYTRYLAHEDRLRGRANTATRELLAIRLAYEGALAASRALTPDLLPAWQRHLTTVETERASAADVRVYWQRAYERRFQRELARTLVGAPRRMPAGRAQVQAVFCIDVRSEPLRRHLEAAAAGVQTLGFAGFFGFALAHSEADRAGASPRCPVLIPPQLTSGTSESADSSVGITVGGAWKAFQNSAASAFAFVETAGAGFAPALARTARPAPLPRCERPRPAFEVAPEALDTLAGVAAGALTGMSLTTGFARLILLCGHGSRTTNNPHASSLACGACGGYSGDVNARVAARVFNHPGIRERLAARGIRVPEDTVFVAGLHDTVTDDVVLLDAADVPTTHRAEWEHLREALVAAGEATRRQRAGLLGLPDSAEVGDFSMRAGDPAQVRPEWGLANNAAMIVGPRHLTAGLDLHGRAFLHEYRSEQDPQGGVLEAILSAPVVVASWINLQYYASRVDPQRYGAGTKVLHDVVGGLGVVEGNFGDLRTGLPLQSLHDGERFRHEARRLSVLVAAPRAKIDAILARRPGVRQLFDHDWIHLLAFEDGVVHQYAPRGWDVVSTPREVDRLAASSR